MLTIDVLHIRMCVFMTIVVTSAAVGAYEQCVCTHNRCVTYKGVWVVVKLTVEAAFTVDLEAAGACGGLGLVLQLGWDRVLLQVFGSGFRPQMQKIKDHF